MLQGAVIVFVIGALGGVGLASFVLRGQLAMWPLSMLHALVGATGLVLTALVVFSHGEPVPPYAGLALLTLALLGIGAGLVSGLLLLRVVVAVCLVALGAAVLSFLHQEYVDRSVDGILGGLMVVYCAVGALRALRSRSRASGVEGGTPAA